MKIAYKNTPIYLNLFIGIIWLINGMYKVFFAEDSTWFDGIWFLLAASYFTLFYFQKFNSYITITNDYIKENRPFGKKIMIANINQIRFFAGDYIIETDQQKLTVNTHLVHKNSIGDLKKGLEKLSIIES